MDYKIWIVLLAIVVLILYLIKEMYFIKFDLLSYINTLKNNHEENNLIIRKNFQNDLNVFANKIKLLNDENLQQFRKITLLNNQPILKNNNYFKEMENSDTNTENMELRYLSDSKIFSKKEQSKKSSNFSETSELTSSNTSIENKNINQYQPKTMNVKEESVYNTNAQNNNTNEKNELLSEAKHENKVSEKENDALENKVNDEDNNEISVEKNLKDNENKNLVETSNTKLDYILETDSETETSIMEENTQESESSEEISFEKEDLELKDNTFSNKVQNKELIENSKYDSITLGTKKSKNQKDNQENKNDLNEIKMPNEVAKNINRENLKSIDDYTLETLKNLAKKFNIPLSIKKSGKWKTLNKTEIYSEISKFLNKKNLN